MPDMPEKIPHLKATVIGKWTQLFCENCCAVKTTDECGAEFYEIAVEFKEEHKDCKDEIDS